MMLKKVLATVIFILATYFSFAQEKGPDGKYWDNNLTYHVVVDNMISKGFLEICVYDSSREMCVDNLMGPFELVVYNAQGSEIWKSLWRGHNQTLKFKKNFPEGSYIEIKATRDFVINKTTGTKIYQKEPIFVKYTLVK